MYPNVKEPKHYVLSVTLLIFLEAVCEKAAGIISYYWALQGGEMFL